MPGGKEHAKILESCPRWVDMGTVPGATFPAVFDGTGKADFDSVHNGNADSVSNGKIKGLASVAALTGPGVTS